MRYFDKREVLKHCLEGLRQQKQTIGFVPTMGALHEGHLTLIRQSVEENDVTVVSIFVNPKQFNDSDDLEKYPRDINKDKALLSQVLNNDDLLFNPTEDQVFDGEEQALNIDFEGLDCVLEGAHRPGHFRGVAEVVERLLAIVAPDSAYFGEKDYQQLLIIQKMVEQLNYQVGIVPVPLVREEDGLAMSSRNQRLSKEDREKALCISRILFQLAERYPDYKPKEMKVWAEEQFANIKGLETEYVAIVDADDLSVADEWHDARYICCVAVQIGGVRLIDNVKINF